MKLRSLLAHFRRDASGVAAVEFAFIAPLLIALLFGLVCVTEAILRQRVLQQTAQSLAWAMSKRAAPATATSLPVLSAHDHNDLPTLVKMNQRSMSPPTDIKVAIRRYVGTASDPKPEPFNCEYTGPKKIYALDLLNTGDPGPTDVAANGVKQGDSIYAVDISYDDPILSFFFGQGNFTLRAHGAM